MLFSNKPLNEQEERFLVRVKVRLENQGRADKVKLFDKLSPQEKRLSIWVSNLYFDHPRVFFFIGKHISWMGPILAPFFRALEFAAQRFRL
jgi:hypothetical protein